MNYIVKLITFLTIFLIGAESYTLGRECLEHEDCPDHKPACFDSICMNLCEGSCGINTFCKLRHRVIPVCYCHEGMIGDPFVKCWNPGEFNVKISKSEEDETSQELIEKFLVNNCQPIRQSWLCTF
ncbi:uncharacterized protein LOC122508492 [Leptopilina heterotoma]|uniref:uncharacterized protein LOC122508492 n=1 Tax=Leptopilina heterotoma TaxID=63436 RepID=UPI001CA9F27B|nr:uncharacterized protein LOC122508492 [Leptopilina heterotoma]